MLRIVHDLVQGIQMVVVELVMLPGEANAATKFLQSKIKGAIKVNGNKIEIEDEKGRDVKLLSTNSCITKVWAVTGFSARLEPSRLFRMTVQLEKKLQRVIRLGESRPFRPCQRRDSR
jgi:hypothetical protein